MDVPSPFLFHSGDLYKLGIRYSRQHLDRLEKAGQFPRRIKLTPNGRIGWLPSEIYAWLRERIRKSREGGPTPPPGGASRQPEV